MSWHKHKALEPVTTAEEILNKHSFKPAGQALWDGSEAGLAGVNDTGCNGAQKLKPQSLLQRSTDYCWYDPETYLKHKVWQSQTALSLSPNLEFWSG